MVKNFWILLVWLVLVSSCSTSRVGELDQSAHAKIEADQACVSDQDCALIKDDCCGCTQGGKQRAVSTIQLKTMLDSLNKQCGETMCIQMMSTDASCFKQALCLDGSCVLQ